MRVNVLKYLCLAGVLLVVVSCSEDGIATLTIVNQSEDTVVLVRVTVNENIQTVKDLQHGEEAEMQFLVKRDADYHIEIEFLTGRKIKKEVGYLTYGLNTDDIITITRTGIEFDNKTN